MTDKSTSIVDIDDINTSDVTREIPHPKTGEPVGIRVTLMSTTDQRLKALKREIQNENLQREKKRKTIKPAEIEENENRLLAATFVSWDWYGATFKGEKPECKPAVIKQVLKAKPWFRSAINEILEDDADFF